MFKKTPVNPQYDMFSTPSTQMGKREAKKYDDPMAWHNRFYANVTSQIDETIFSPLFKQGNMGAPNASIRVIIGMSIIKEGFGYSDEDLFEKCQFDLLVRKALGLFSLSDVTPSIDTYYLLRRRICEYENQYSVNLMEKSFEQLTSEQLSTCRISGKCKYRYFTDEQIATAELRRKLAAIPGHEQMKRNNVEATIFQYCYHTRNNKTRYRGLLKHKLYPFAGCSWISHVRLGNYLITIG